MLILSCLKFKSDLDLPDTLWEAGLAAINNGSPEVCKQSCTLEIRVHIVPKQNKHTNNCSHPQLLIQPERAD